MPLTAPFCIDVIEAYRALSRALEAASAAIQSDSALPGWMHALEYPLLQAHNGRTEAINLIGQNQYLDNQEGRSILIGMGLFGASDNTLKVLHELNAKKRAFKQAILQLKADRDNERLHRVFEALLSTERHGNTQAALKRSGMARLHLKQCYRQIPILEQRPLKVSWSWANTRSIKRITKADAVALLKKKGDDPGIQRQLMQVESLRPQEQIAIVQNLAPHLRTNVVFETADGLERKMLKGSLPLFYPASAGEPLPEVVLPKPKNSERQKRSDIKIDPEPFLPAIRGHRYQAA